jgi:hypothetical protein
MAFSVKQQHTDFAAASGGETLIPSRRHRLAERRLTTAIGH